MKLIFLLIFVFNLLSIGKTKDVRMHGQLERYDYRLISVSLSKSYGFYLDMSEFEDVNSTIEIKIDIYNGYLTEKEMYYGFTDVLYPYYKDLIFHAWVNYTSKTSMEKKDTKIDTFGRDRADHFSLKTKAFYSQLFAFQNPTDGS